MSSHNHWYSSFENPSGDVVLLKYWKPCIGPALKQRMERNLIIQVINWKRILSFLMRSDTISNMKRGLKSDFRHALKDCFSIFKVVNSVYIISILSILNKRILRDIIKAAPWNDIHFCF